MQMNGNTTIQKTRIPVIRFLYISVVSFLRYNYDTEVIIMPTIIPIRDLRNTSEISELAHKMQEPIFITKNGYSDLVVMSTELYEKFAQNNRIDQAIFEAEKEVEEGVAPVSLGAARKKLDKKYHGKV